MCFVSVEKDGVTATVTLSRGKVNALNQPVVNELKHQLLDLETDRSIHTVILTGRGAFFSFGFDVPEFMDYSKRAFTEFLNEFTDLYTYLFLFPKPVIAALNGHTIAAGCMLASACDYRIMVTGNAKISLNEVTFGSSVFHGSAEILKYCIGSRNAELMLTRGAMYQAEEAYHLGLIHRTTSRDGLLSMTRDIATEYAETDLTAFYSIKRILRGSVAERFVIKEALSIPRFVDIWYSESTRSALRDIRIYGNGDIS